MSSVLKCPKSGFAAWFRVLFCTYALGHYFIEGSESACSRNSTLKCVLFYSFEDILRSHKTFQERKVALAGFYVNNILGG